MIDGSRYDLLNLPLGDWPRNVGNLPTAVLVSPRDDVRVVDYGGESKLGRDNALHPTVEICLNIDGDRASEVTVSPGEGCTVAPYRGDGPAVGYKVDYVGF
eukprot:1388042-Amorphochlora_amoeboformis.AAC.1